MSRHEIRIRRGSFSSNRIQRHKDYRSLLSRHKKHNRLRLLIVSVIVILLIFMLIGFAFRYF